MVPLHQFLINKEIVLSDLNKADSPSKEEEIDLVIQNVTNKIRKSDLTSIAHCSDELRAIQKILRRIGSKARKHIDLAIFKLFQVQLSKVRQGSIDLERYEKFDRELDILVNELRDGPSDDETIKRVGRFINENLAQFYFSANKLGGTAKVDAAQAKLEQLSVIAAQKTESPLIKKLQKQIMRILPKPSKLTTHIPQAVYSEGIAIHLAEIKNPEEALTYYRQLINQTQNLSPRGRLLALAKWINNSKVFLSWLPLSKEQIYELAPLLTHIYVQKNHKLYDGSTWKRGEVEKLIEQHLKI